MNSLELLEHLKHESERLNAQADQIQTEIAEIYAEPDNLTTHSPPDFEKYYYKSNPTTLGFDNTGILKSSTPGHQIKKLLNFRSLNLKNIKQLNNLNHFVNTNPSLTYDIPCVLSSGAAIVNWLSEWIGRNSKITGIKMREPEIDWDSLSPDEKRTKEREMRTM
ncbi:MAG: hypothetical protein H6Q69_972 [Firmicutes bacterium]|nr:hypothetical protein [Bacillota bacterium]